MGMQNHLKRLSKMLTVLRRWRPGLAVGVGEAVGKAGVEVTRAMAEAKAGGDAEAGAVVKPMLQAAGGRRRELPMLQAAAGGRRQELPMLQAAGARWRELPGPVRHHELGMHRQTRCSHQHHRHRRTHHQSRRTHQRRQHHQLRRMHHQSRRQLMSRQAIRAGKPT